MAYLASGLFLHNATTSMLVACSCSISVSNTRLASSSSIIIALIIDYIECSFETDLQAVYITRKDGTGELIKTPIQLAIIIPHECLGACSLNLLPVKFLRMPLLFLSG